MKSLASLSDIEQEACWLLPDAQGRRIVAPVEQLRAWHGEALKRLALR